MWFPLSRYQAANFHPLPQGYAEAGCSQPVQVPRLSPPPPACVSPPLRCCLCLLRPPSPFGLAGSAGTLRASIFRADCALHTLLPPSSGCAASGRCCCAMCKSFPGFRCSWFPGKTILGKGHVWGGGGGRAEWELPPSQVGDRVFDTSSLNVHFMSV